MLIFASVPWAGGVKYLRQVTQISSSILKISLVLNYTVPSKLIPNRTARLQTVFKSTEILEMCVLIVVKFS